MTYVTYNLGFMFIVLNLFYNPS